MAPQIIQRNDRRFPTLNRGRNGRFAQSTATADRILLCQTEADVAEALQQAVRAGMRPTVRSGGHCNEDFVYTNPGGAVIDISALTATSPTPGNPPFRLGAGVPLGVAYTNLFKFYGVTLPGGSCETVGAGGHICGGGYGLLSRLQGLSSDWLSAVDILTVDAHGKVLPLRVDRTHHPDLLRASRGAGGGNFGIITNYYFDKLPPAPLEVATANLTFSWDGMTLERFTSILQTYGTYWETRGQQPDTWGLFSLFSLAHKSNGHFTMSIQFCNPDGTCKDLSVLTEFLDGFDSCDPVPHTPEIAARTSTPHMPSPPTSANQVCHGQHVISRHLWLDANVKGTGAGIASELRGKHKSSYMKKSFTAAEAALVYKHLTRDMPLLQGFRGSVSVDSYGGAINDPALVRDTAVPQRASCMKLQFLSYWDRPEQDRMYLQWIDDFYKDLYSGPDADAAHAGTPFPNQRYEGCYINYPDTDMLRYEFWPELYYGTGDLYPTLQNVKQTYDPGNIFHHAMSIRPRKMS